MRLEGCSHPVVMKGLCAECGQDLTQIRSKNGKQNVPLSTATVSMVHSVPELKVSSEQAEQLGREDQQRLHRNRKLVLMVDLAQPLIHTTEQHCQQMSNKGIFHFQLGRGEPMLHTRLRPHCKEFLEKIAKLYELHVFTFGSRLYAHTIAGTARVSLQGMILRFAAILKHSRDFWILKRSFFPIEYYQGMNVLIHFLKLGILEISSHVGIPWFV